VYARLFVEGLFTMYSAGGNQTIVSPNSSQLVSIPVPDDAYVLVVDDDDAILTVVMLLLESEEFVGVGFSDSQQVLPFLRNMGTNRLPSVILLDLMMPIVSGYEIAAQLSQDVRLSRIPIVVMTADNRVRSVNAVPGAVDLIGKPFQVNVLLAKLGQYLS
jgi:CheY-like chemotaxis protein